MKTGFDILRKKAPREVQTTIVSVPKDRQCENDARFVFYLYRQERFDQVADVCGRRSLANDC